MGFFAFLVLFVFGHMSAALCLLSSTDMMQSFDGRIEAKVSKLEDEIKLKTKQLRKDISLIYGRLHGFDEQMKLLFKEEKKMDSHVRKKRQDRTDDDDEEKTDGFKQTNKGICGLVTQLKKEKEVKREIMTAVESLTTAVSLMFEVIGEIGKSLNSMKHGSETKMAEITNILHLIQEKFNLSQKSTVDINTKLALLTRDVLDMRNEQKSIRQTTDISKESMFSFGQSVNTLETKMTERHGELKDNFNGILSFLNGTVNICLPSVDSTPTTPMPTSHTSCRDGIVSSGVYKIKISATHTFDAYCDMETGGGGWLVFQRRKDGSVDFYRNWQEYKEGFGNVSGEFWLGNDIIHKLTSTASHELRIDLWDWDGTTRFAKYSTFSISSESDKYRLRVDEYSGTAGDSMINSRISRRNAKHEAFSTKDQDNDSWKTGACAVPLHGAWWYKSCTSSCLNGRYYTQAQFLDDIQSGISWHEWKGPNYSLKGSEMKIRPK